MQLPGRGWRLREEPMRDLDRMADEVVAALDTVQGRLALFGHSMGAWLGLEVARRLSAGGRAPEVLFASGRQAPSIPSRLPPMGQLDQAQFVAAVQQRYGGIPNEILGDKALLGLLIPALRADISALESYRYRKSERLPCPLVVLGGEDDPHVSREDLAQWESEAGADFRVRSFAGGHFYLSDPSCGLFEYLTQELHALRFARTTRMVVRG